ncbi:MAG: preprotein translocase subunit SecE [Actinomycetota bacterium]
MNREEKRRLQRQGQLGPDGTPAPAAGAVQDRQRRVRQTGQRQASSGNPLARSAEFLRETRGELRKVAWPTRLEVRNYSVVVFVTLVLLISLIFVLDYACSKSILFLFHA